jgi:hypothetical protein
MQQEQQTSGLSLVLSCESSISPNENNSDDEPRRQRQAFFNLNFSTFVCKRVTTVQLAVQFGATNYYDIILQE